MKLMKYIYLVVLISVLFGCGSSGITAKDESKLSVEGTFLVNGKGEKIVLQGISFGWHNWWPRFYNASVVKQLKQEWNCTVVRAAMGVEPDGAYLNNPERAIACVTAVADEAIKNNMYVIIDWHSHGIHTEEAKEFFIKMANRYRDSPYVIYEIFNEPVEDSWETVKAYSEEVIRVIRAIDTDNVILVGTPHWDQDVHLAADNPIAGYKNIMYTLHFYAATHGQYLRERADYALSKGLPLFVSECAGMEASGDGPVNRQEWDAWCNWMQKHDISWVCWSVSDKDETCSMLYPDASSEGNWAEKDLKDWGRIVKKELQKVEE